MFVVLVLGSGFFFFLLLSIKICLMAWATQWLMLKPSDVFWKCNRSNFQPMSQEICMFQWIKTKMKAGCVGRPGSDRIIPSCFLGCRVITKRGFLPSLFNPHHWILEGCGHCQLPCWVTCMFCTTGKLMIRLWPENKPQWERTAPNSWSRWSPDSHFLDELVLFQWCWGKALFGGRRQSVALVSEIRSHSFAYRERSSLLTGKDKACTLAALYSVSRKASEKIRFSFCTLTKSCTDYRSLHVALTASTAVFHSVAAALPHLILLPSLFATSPAPGSWGCCGSASPRAWEQRVHGRAFWVSASNGKLKSPAAFAAFAWKW